jgi:dolichol-phosphate mannosyltransferase
VSVAAWGSAIVAEHTAAPAPGIAAGLRRRGNWVQLLKFGVVGASGYAVNLVVYGALLGGGIDFRLAAVVAFLVAVTSNYTWNRLWTFREQRGHFAYQGLRFFVVSVVVLGANLCVLSLLVLLGVHELRAQAAAVVAVTPLNFLGNKLWSFRR